MCPVARVELSFVSTSQYIVSTRRVEGNNPEFARVTLGSCAAATEQLSPVPTPRYTPSVMGVLRSIDRSRAHAEGCLTTMKFQRYSLLRNYAAHHAASCRW